MTKGEGWTYRRAGVDRRRAEEAKARIADLVRSTARGLAAESFGRFAGIFPAPEGGAGGAGGAQPLLVATADGVGTKVKVARLAGRHDTVGQDLVHHCVNDLLCLGARPLFFLDYIGAGKLEPGVVEALVAGMANACRENDCALIGGETAEMPDTYADGEYDLVGFAVGWVERARLLDPSGVRAADRLIALPSSGLHTNGYTLARKIIFEVLGLRMDDSFPGMDARVADVLLEVHRSYYPSVYPELETGRIHAIAHITGGGLPDNLARALPPDLDAVVWRDSWQVPLLFQVLQEAGGVPGEEMFRTFNMGIGMILIAEAGAADAVLEGVRKRGEHGGWVCGVVQPGKGRVQLQPSA